METCVIRHFLVVVHDKIIYGIFISIFRLHGQVISDKSKVFFQSLCIFIIRRTMINMHVIGVAVLFPVIQNIYKEQIFGRNIWTKTFHICQKLQIGKILFRIFFDTK